MDDTRFTEYIEESELGVVEHSIIIRTKPFFRL